MSTDRPAKQSSALEKALLVLEAIGAEGRPMSLAAIAAATGLPKQTGFRVLQQLQEARMVQRSVRPECFVLGPRCRGLALRTLSAGVGSLPAHAVLEELVADVGESANVGVLDGLSVLYLDRVEYAWPLRLQINPNDKLPAHCLSIGKLLLAHLPARSRERLISTAKLQRFTTFTITDPHALEAEFDRIVEQGYALNNQEYHEGLVGAAVPVQSASGEVVAGLAIHGVGPRASLDSLAAHLPRMRQAAGRIAELMLDT